MNLVNELQVSAESEEVLIVLRKARRLASKLGVTDIDAWLKAEQNGYVDGHAIPQYRMVKGSLVFSTNGPVPIGLGMAGNGIMDYPGGFFIDRAMADSMGEVIALIEGITGTKNGLYMQMEDNGNFDGFRRNLNHYIANQVTFMLKMNIAQVRAIPEAVKDKILDWACELERKGVHGDNMTFNEKERQLAHAITFNISNSKIEQLNDAGDNLKIANNSAPVVVSGSEVVQSSGSSNMVEVAPQDKPSLGAKVWEWLKNAWKWILGLFVGKPV